LGYFRNIGQAFGTSVKGLSIIARHLFSKKVTKQYPEPKDRYEMPERARNRLYVNMDDCIGCDQCARACPVNCITIDTAKAIPGENLGITSNGRKKALWVTKFDIDIAKCCYCSLCVYPCPTECIVMTDVFEFSAYNRDELVYNFETMDREEAALHIANAQKADEAAKEARAKQAAERAAKLAEGGTQPQATTPPYMTGGVKPPPFMAKPKPPEDPSTDNSQPATDN
jgi:NADH-quinone oxidoreductase subunit I